MYLKLRKRRVCLLGPEYACWVQRMPAGSRVCLLGQEYAYWVKSMPAGSRVCLLGPEYACWAKNACLVPSMPAGSQACMPVGSQLGFKLKGLLMKSNVFNCSLSHQSKRFQTIFLKLREAAKNILRLGSLVSRGGMFNFQLFRGCIHQIQAISVKIKGGST